MYLKLDGLETQTCWTRNTDLLDHHGLRCGIVLYYDDSMVQNIVCLIQGSMFILPLKLKTNACRLTCNNGCSPSLHTQSIRLTSCRSFPVIPQ